MKKTKILTLVLIMIFVSSSILLAQDASDKAKTLTPKSDKSLVYVLRPSGIAFAVRFPVVVDGKAIATLGVRDFGFINLDPGKHTFKVVNGTSKATLLDLNTELGKVYYLIVEPKMSAVTARGVLKPVKDGQGIKYLKKCGLADNNQEKL